MAARWRRRVDGRGASSQQSGKRLARDGLLGSPGAEDEKRSLGTPKRDFRISGSGGNTTERRRDGNRCACGRNQYDVASSTAIHRRRLGGRSASKNGGRGSNHGSAGTRGAGTAGCAGRSEER